MLESEVAVPNTEAGRESAESRGVYPVESPEVKDDADPERDPVGGPVLIGERSFPLSLPGELTGAAASLAPEPHAAVKFERYQAWTPGRPIKDPNAASYIERMQILVEIVEVEGPILGHRLYQQYVKGAGGKKVGPQIAKVLNRASNGAESRGVLVSENPLDEQGQKIKTFRLSEQPKAPIRDLGPRDLAEVPPLELAAVLDSMRDSQFDEEEWFRALLKFYGLVRLTPKVRKQLIAAAGLVVS